jgi:hypothetical protein
MDQILHLVRQPVLSFRQHVYYDLMETGGMVFTIHSLCVTLFVREFGIHEVGNDIHPPVLVTRAPHEDRVL